jgi:hypothetical protein
MGSHNPGNSLEGVDWGDVYAKAVAIALTCVPRQDAEDVVMAGVTKVLDGSDPWDPAGKSTLASHVVAVGRRERESELRKARRREHHGAVEAFAEDADADRPWTPEEHVSEAEERDEKARRYGRLVALCGGDPDALAVLECLEQGIDEPADQVTETGLTLDAVRNARKRIKRRAETLVETDDEEAAS